jgi:PAS domain S-box-containing protein
MTTDLLKANEMSHEAQADQALRASEIRYRRLFEAAKDGILILDVETGRINEVNPFLFNLLRLSRHEMIGRTIDELSPFKNMERNDVMLKRLQKERYVRYDNVPLETWDGRQIAAEFVCNVYEEGDKNVIQCNIRDITERKNSENTLRDSEIRYRRLFEAAKDGILILDVGTGRITDVNPYFFHLLGFAREEMIGRTVGELSPFKDIESNQVMLERLQKDGYVRYENLPLETREGQHIAVEFVSNVYRAGDHNVIQCNVRNITERKKAEDEIRYFNAKLEQCVVERTAQLESFSYSVSHDLQAPLRHVLESVEVMQREAGPAFSEKGGRHLAKISEAVKKMGKLISDLLSFSRIGQSDLQKREVNLDALVRDTLADFETPTPGRTIVWEIHPLPVVRADRALLQMVLVNLISNAVKFTGTQVEARIEIGSVPNTNDEVVIFIHDNGAGFDQQYASKLFGVFQRLHSQDEFAGTGIGLANVQRIIVRHGGRVWAEGIINGGATFYFSLPIPKKGDANGASGK